MKTLKAHTRVYRILQKKSSRYFGLLCIAISIAAIIMGSFKDMEPYRDWLFSVTYLTSFVFLLEYIARLFSAPAKYPEKSFIRARLKYAFSFYGFVDFVAILPWILTYFFSDTPIVHVVILPYIFIIFKLIRHSRSFKLIGQAIAAVKEELLTAYAACLILVSFSAILMYFIERNAQPDVFANIGDGFWWSIVAFTTTGYGDIYPVTGLGKLLGSIISLIGIAMIAIPTGIFSSSFINVLQQRDKTKVRMHDEDGCSDDAQ